MQIGDVSRALEVLLMCLELDRGIVSHSEFAGENSSETENGTQRIFASPVGISVIAESLNQMAVARFAQCNFNMAFKIFDDSLDHACTTYGSF